MSSRPRPTKPAGSFVQNLGAVRAIPRFFRLIWQTSPRLALANIGLRLIQALIPVALLYVGKLIVDQVLAQSAAAAPDWAGVWRLVGAEFGLALLSDALGRLITLTDSLVVELYSNRVSVELIQKAAAMDLWQLEDPEFYDKLDQAQRQTTARTNLTASVLSQGQDLITVAALVVGLAVVEPWLIGLLVLAIVPAFVSELIFSQSSYSLAKRWTPEQRMLSYLAYIGATNESAKEVKLFNLSGYLSERFARLAARFYAENRRLAMRRAGWGSLFNLLSSLAYYLAYAIIIVRAVNGQITLGELTFLAGSFNRLQTRVQAIFSRFTSITTSALYLQDYFDFLDLPVSAPGSAAAPAPAALRRAIVFEEVGFRYPGAEDYVFRNLSFELRAGEKLALVGRNGAGKTTVVKLLLRLYEPTEGRITFDGVDIRDFDAAAYRELFSAIFQDFVRYNFTAGENIGVGMIERIDDRERIAQAAAKSQADEVIAALPAGYDQQLGKRFKSGAELSGGQWQKIALARAYVADAAIIVLDEPTAALDAQAEYETFLRFIDLTSAKTTVIISHRFSTVRMADRIAVLGNGRLLELGSHAELMAADGMYADLFRLQAQGYQ
ncbi:MAG TPA: ABC transporter ATP-binding protein [Herpetosiphonaceae bacterium]|nr:ABC transporter ATP-binding protein [Herpetosiphonaceae bacterium]